MSIFKSFFAKFFAWYKRNYKINLYITSGLLLWQLVHLFWMATNVIGPRLFGHEFWHIGSTGNIIIALVDYTEIPAIILGSLFYIHEIGKEKDPSQSKVKWKNIFLLTMLNIQWLHLFWITDEIVVDQFTGAATHLLPLWLSWVAIMIDYLELPVIYDTVKKSIQSLRKST